MVDFTDGIDVVVGGAILASHTDNLADNTEFNRSWGDVEHNYDISTADGSHKDITFGADSTYDIAETAVRPAVVYSDKFDVLAGGEVSLDGGNGTYIKEITDDVIVLGIDSVNQTYFDDDKLNAAWDLDTDDGTLRVNWTGYQGGTTRYRDIVVYTGKSVPMTWWDGSANITYYYSDLNLAESLTVAQNKAIYLDTDKDTYFLAPTDDRIDYYVAGQQKLIIGSTYVQVINAELQLTGGDIILDVDGDSKLDNVSDDILAVVMGAGEVGRWDASGYNGVLGATTPAAATVTTLTANTSATISSFSGTGAYLDILQAGGGDYASGIKLQTFSTAYGFTINNDDTSGSQRLEILRHENSVGGASALSILRASGNVGIGTASPDGTLHVHTATSGSLTAATGADDLVVENNTTGGISILTPDASDAAIYFGTPTGTNTTAFLGSNYSNNYVQLATNYATGTIQLRTGSNVLAATIDASGNLGLGVMPSSLWDGVFTVSEVGYVGCGLASSAATQIDLIANVIYDDTDNRWELASNGAASMIQQTAGVISMFTNASGSLGDAAFTGTAKLTIANNGTVNSTIATDTVSQLVLSNGSADPYGIFIDWTAADPNDTANYYIACRDNVPQLDFVVYSDGSVQGRANSYGGISDVTLKNITVEAADMRSYWDDFKKIDYIKWQWKNEFEKDGDEAKQLFGMSAQQLQTVFPGAVYEGADGKLGTKDSVVHSIGMKVLQEAQVRIEDNYQTMQTFMGRDIERKTELETLREKVTAQGKEIVELQEQLKRAA